MESIKEVLTSVRAGQVFGYCQTKEHERTIDFIQNEVDNYLTKSGDKPYKSKVWGIGDLDGNDADVFELLKKIDTSEPGTVWILKNFNWFLDEKNVLGKYSYEIIQIFQDKLASWRTVNNRKFVLIVTSTPIESGLPKELIDYFSPYEFERPNADEVRIIFDRIYGSIKKRYGDNIADMDELEINRVVNAACGMTTIEIEDSFAKSLTKHNALVDFEIHKAKSKVLEKTSAIEYGQFDVTYDDIVGNDNLKERIVKTAPHPLSKGIILVGPPGCGKTMLSQAVGNQIGRPVLVVELANTYGSLVGESYERMNAVIEVIKAMRPCVVLFDELEKGLSGVGSGDSGGNTGNEITKRSASILLKFLSEPHPDIYVLATVNSIDAFRTAPEYLRAGRWDSAPFYVGLPDAKEKKAILDFYKEKFEVKGDPGVMDGWSGAEIEACCRQSAMTGESLKESAGYIKPIGQIVGKAELERLARWADDNAIPATKPLKMKTEKIQQNGERAIDL